MLSRKDLSNEFSLLVQQENIKTQKFIDQNNKSIVNINQRIDNFASNVDSRIDKLDSEFSKNCTSVCHVFDKLEKMIEKLNCDLFNYIIEFKTIKQKQDVIFKFCEDLQELFKNCRRDDDVRFNLVFKEIHKHVEEIKNINEYTNQCYRKSLLQTEIVRNEILDRPSEAQQVKKEIEATMKIDKVNFDGLIKEIRVLNKKLFVVEKNIENIYTEIENSKMSAR